MFGSVPLKTYLPDGDIDLAVFQGKGPRLRDIWTYELSALLEAEGRNPLNPHRVKDVQIINAEVKLLKCLVDNILVDISFDTLGGLCTVAFLESIDRHIGKHHLFKRSVILVKAWCYYESRLLGAHHGLLSTYALETMVLYIFNMYHHELQSPLKVLRKFLDVFSKFDWDAHALSLQGPIPLSSFPEPQVEPVAGAEGGALLRGDVLNAMLEMYSPRLQQGPGKTFAIKNVNIVDPLLPTNNLGRSVNKASKARIRKALAHGSHMLDSIFEKVGHEAIEAADNFFRNTWNAQRTQLPFMGRLHPDSLANVANFCRPLMVPAVISPVPSQPHSAESQAFINHAYLMPYPPQAHLPALAGMHDNNSNGAMELGRAGRAYSGPLPERPHSSASNMSANSDPPGPSPGGEAWVRSQAGAAHVQSALVNGGGRDVRRSDSGRAGPSGIDPGGHQRRDSGGAGPHPQGHFEGGRSNGMVSMPLAGQEQMLLPMYGYAVQGMAYPVHMQPGHPHLRYHPPAVPTFGPALSLPNGRIYHQQQSLLPASAGLMYQRPATQSNGVEVTEAQASDLLEGDLLTLSQHLIVARRCHQFVTSIAQDSVPGTEQRLQDNHPPSQQQTASHIRTSRSQLGLDQHRSAQGMGARNSGHQRGQLGVRRESAPLNQRPRAPTRSNSADNLDVRHIRAQVAADGATAPAPAAVPSQRPQPMPHTKPSPASAAAPAAESGASPVSQGRAFAQPGGLVGGSTSAPKVVAEAGVAQSSSRHSPGLAQAPATPSTGPLRPADASTASHPGVAGSASVYTQPQPVRTLADAVREGPSSSQRGTEQQAQKQEQPANSAQHQPGAAPGTPTKSQPGPYSSAVLGLGRPQRSPVQNGPVSIHPASAAAAGPSRSVVGSPTGPLHPVSSPPAAHRLAGAGPPAAGAHGRLRVDTSADGSRGKAAQGAPQSAAPPPPKQPPTPPPAKFALNSEGDFPQLGAVKTRGRSPRSPAGSAAQTPVADSKPTSPSFSAASTPATATAKGVWSGNSAGLLQSAGHSPASWSNRPDARPMLNTTRQHAADAGGTSRSEGSSPMAGSSKGAVWPPPQSASAAWRGAAAGGPPQSSALGSSPGMKR
ncbi:g6387 [Coccomyxa elongata]